MFTVLLDSFQGHIQEGTRVHGGMTRDYRKVTLSRQTKQVRGSGAGALTKTRDPELSKLRDTRAASWLRFK
jgi:hypothetical protein